MPDAIIAALITGACAILAQVYISHRTTRDLYMKLDKQSEVADTRIRGEIAVIKAEIAELKDETRKHNSLIDRTYALEKRMDVTEERQKVANHRIDKLEAAEESEKGEKGG